VNELVWEVEFSLQADATAAFRPQTYRGTLIHRPISLYRIKCELAPSWSWASLEGRIIYPELRNTVPLVRILEVYITPFTSDLTGQVIHGWAKIEGMLRPLPTDIPEVTRYNALSPDSGRTNDLSGLFVLPVLSHDDPAGDEQQIFGLLLQPTETGSSEYRRVGLLSQNAPGGFIVVPGLEWDFSNNEWEQGGNKPTVVPQVITII
jgi:hypothetical protein